MKLFPLILAVLVLAGLACSAEEQPTSNSETAVSADQKVVFESFDTAPKPVEIVSPAYPETARIVNAIGTTHVELVVDDTGHVRETRIIKSSGNADLDQAAEEAALQSTFEPARKEGAAVVAKIVIPFEFKLD